MPAFRSPSAWSGSDRLVGLTRPPVDRDASWTAVVAAVRPGQAKRGRILPVVLSLEEEPIPDIVTPRQSTT